MRAISSLFVMVCLVVNTVAAAGLVTDKSTYSPGEMMTVTFSGGNSTKDWLGMYNSTITPATKNSLLWVYLNGKQKPVPSAVVGSGRLQFFAPQNPGDYKFCFHPNGQYGVGAVARFRVQRQALTTNKAFYNPGETITVKFSCGRVPKDWLGMYRFSTTPAVKNSVEWTYLSGTKTVPVEVISSGMLQFNAPMSSGKYKFCFHPNGCYAVGATAYFSVQQAVANAGGTISSAGRSVSKAYRSRLRTSPVAQFSSTMTAIRQGSSVNFIDLSKNKPTSWSWRFEGGMPAYSSEKNPTVNYKKSGVYSVTLTSSNSAGYNKVAKRGYITVAKGGGATHLKCMQFNVWKEGTSVRNGMAYIRDIVATVNPDVVSFSEVYNYNDQDWTAKIVKELASLGLKYYRGYVGGATSIISKFPIISSDQASVTSIFTIDVYGKDVLVASTRLDATHYAAYLPRGYRCFGSVPLYDGWGALDAPVTDTAIIYSENLDSQRDEQIAAFINEVKGENLPIILLGDFNEPSHLDWTKKQANMFDHHGVIYQWPNTLSLANNSFTDVYRKIHTNEVKYPGISWPSTTAANTNTTRLKGDKRDRINYIFYRGRGVRATKVALVGPKSYYVNGDKSTDCTDHEDFLASEMPWPSDHKGIWANIVIPGTR